MIQIHTHTPEAGTVGELVAQVPQAVKVLQRHGIDFCCGGHKLLADVCARAGVPVATLLAEVAEEAAPQNAIAWTTLPLTDVVDEIERRFHRPLDAELPRLQQMAQKVLRVHGEKDPARFTALAATVDALVVDLVPHLQKEEMVLFPFIRRGQGAQTNGPVAVMHMEHEAVGELLVRLAALTDNFTPPLLACNTWRALYQGLADLDRDTREHIHVENNILFPRALRGDAA